MYLLLVCIFNETLTLTLSHNLKATLKELFPSLEAVEKYREVIIFTTGLLENPRPLVDHIYEMQIEEYLNDMRKDLQTPSLIHNKYIFTTLYTESTVALPGHPLHNRHINYYQHGATFAEEESCIKYTDTTPINTPSKLYEFNRLRKYIRCDIEHIEHALDIRDCAINIDHPAAKVTQNVLSICRTISKHYPLTDLCMNNVVCDHLTESDVFNLSENVQSLSVTDCKLPNKIISHLMEQMSHCKHICKLDLHNTTLGEGGLYLAQGIRSWGDNPLLEILNLDYCSLSSNVCAELLQSVSNCKNLVILGLRRNDVAGCFRIFLKDSHRGLPNLQVLGLDYEGWTKEDFRHCLRIAHKLPKLTDLDLSHNTLTGCLSSFLPDPDPHKGLQFLDSLSLQCTELDKVDFKHLSSIIQSNKLPKLRELDLSSNTLKGYLSMLLPDPHPGLPHLVMLSLRNTALNKKDIQHLTHLIQARKMPRISALYVNYNRLYKKEKESGELIEAFITYFQWRLELCENVKLSLSFDHNDLSQKFKKKWKGHCEGVNDIELLM